MKKNSKFLNLCLLIDGNHLLYRAYYKFNLKTLDGVRTNVIYGFPFILESLIRRFGPDDLYVVFDWGRSEYRKAIHPDYKKREKKLGFDSENFHLQKEVVIDILTNLGVKVIRKKGWECDDFIAKIAIERTADKKGDTIIVSADKDFEQLVTNKSDCNTLMYHVTKNHLYTHNVLLHEKGYKPYQSKDYLCLCGDKSDNISGYPGIGEKRGKKFLKEFNSIKKFLKSDSKFGNIDKDKLASIYELNNKLINLKYFYLKYMVDMDLPINMPAFDIGNLKIICSRYEINTFIKPQFYKTFKEL